MSRAVYINFNNKKYKVNLTDNETVKDFLSLLPMEYSFSDMDNIEKIGYPKRRLLVKEEDKGWEPKKGDVCYYLPYGSIAIFYEDCEQNSNLVYLGAIESDIEDFDRIGVDFKLSAAEE